MRTTTFSTRALLSGTVICLSPHLERVIPVGDDVRRRAAPAATYTLIAGNVAAFAYSLARGFEYVVSSYGFKPAYLLEGVKLETLLTSLFLHGGFAHLAGNMLFLYIFGRSVEDRLGPLPYFLLYLASGVAGCLLHSAAVLLMPPSLVAGELARPLIGASGAISGVLGAYVVFFPEARVLTLVPYYYIVLLRVPARFYVLAWFAYQLALGAAGLGYPLAVAAWAHVGGFAAGAAAALALERVARRP
jgi:membrane associated rhomboid family serine protease